MSAVVWIVHLTSAFALTRQLTLSLSLVALCVSVLTQTPSQVAWLAITVLDENGVAVESAEVSLKSENQPRHCITDRAGHCTFGGLRDGPWQVRVQKEGFYVLTLSSVQPSGSVEVKIAHEQEVKETVNVVESPTAIDPSQISAQEHLSGLDILNIPYPNTRDYRYALAFIPGVVLDPSAQPHVAGAETYQTLVLLDGFNLAQPANGQLLVRVSTDALRMVKAETSRIPAESGKGPAGILGLETGIGDDHIRFDAAYSLEIRTGFPFAVINSQQQLVEPPGAHRFPNYFSLNLHLEKRFGAFGLHGALRGGFDNITNHQNPYVVGNVIGSSKLLTFSAFDSRAFTARIRILGRK